MRVGRKSVPARLCWVISTGICFARPLLRLEDVTMKIMAIGAHPDDIEFMCSGTLFLLRGRGFQFHLTTMTRGDCGTVEHSVQEIQRIRSSEALRAAEVLGAQWSTIGLLDCRVFLNKDVLERTTEEIRKFGPDIVFTHFPRDYMVDHEETSRIVRSATFNLSMPNFHTGASDPAPVTEHIPYLYYWAPMEGMDIFGNPVISAFYVDVETVLDKKKEMLACHASQRDWLLKQHGMDEYIGAMEENARRTGRLAGVTYAEAFTQHRGHAYPRDNILAEHLHIIEDRSHGFTAEKT